MSLAAGTKLGRYEVVRALAKGGMADLLLARSSGIAGFERHVVLKCIRADVANDDQFVQMFVTEARLAGALHHHNIVQVHDIGQADQLHFLAMEYVHGEDLRKVLAQLNEKDRQMPIQHVLTIASNVAAALHHAHEQVGSDRKPLGIVHRDVNPSNVIVCYDGNVKVVDFGIAKATMRFDTNTQAGILKGKVPYMAPEQCAGKTIDRRSDIFSLGIVLYELATVRRLFKGDTEFLTMSAIVQGNIPPPSQHRADLPSELEQIILRALALDPDQRYQTADEMRAALDALSAKHGGASSSGLAAFVQQLFGLRPMPWLVEDDEPEIEVTADFDGSRSGLVEPPSETSAMALPEQVSAPQNAPIMKARTRAITGDQVGSKSALKQTAKSLPSALQNARQQAGKPSTVTIPVAQGRPAPPANPTIETTWGDHDATVSGSETTIAKPGAATANERDTRPVPTRPTPAKLALDLKATTKAPVAKAATAQLGTAHTKPAAKVAPEDEKTAVKIDTNPVPKVGPEDEKTAVKIDTKPVAKPIANGASNGAKVAPKVDTRPIVKIDPKDASKPVPKVTTDEASKPVAKLDSKDASKPVPKIGIKDVPSRPIPRLDGSPGAADSKPIPRRTPLPPTRPASGGGGAIAAAPAVTATPPARAVVMDALAESTVIDPPPLAGVSDFTGITMINPDPPTPIAESSAALSARAAAEATGTQTLLPIDIEEATDIAAPPLPKPADPTEIVKPLPLPETHAAPATSIEVDPALTVEKGPMIPRKWIAGGVIGAVLIAFIIVIIPSRGAGKKSGAVEGASPPPETKPEPVETKPEPVEPDPAPTPIAEPTEPTEPPAPPDDPEPVVDPPKDETDIKPEVTKPATTRPAVAKPATTKPKPKPTKPAPKYDPNSLFLKKKK